MRKILLGFITVALLLITIVTIKQGFTIQKFNIFGIENIIEKNDEIDTKIEQLKQTVEVQYPAAVKILDNASKTMEKTKKEYEDKAVLLGNSKYYLQTEEYKIEFLWTKLGNYAKDEEVEIKIDVTNSQLSGRYDLNFTISGNYTDVIQFIYDVENDSKLGFKIENFHMVSGGDVTDEVETNNTENNGTGEKVTRTRTVVQATFSCKDIKIDLKSVDGNNSNRNINVNTNTNTNSSTKANEGENNTGTSPTEEFKTSYPNNSNVTTSIDEVDTTYQETLDE